MTCSPPRLHRVLASRDLFLLLFPLPSATLHSCPQASAQVTPHSSSIKAPSPIPSLWAVPLSPAVGPSALALCLLQVLPVVSPLDVSLLDGELGPLKDRAGWGPGRRQATVGSMGVGGGVGDAMCGTPAPSPQSPRPGQKKG